MSTEVKVPRLAESISEAVLVEWLKADGATVKTDEAIVTLETDKAAVELAATESGVLRHARGVGERVVVGDVIARIEAQAAASSSEARAEALPRAQTSAAKEARPAATAASQPPDGQEAAGRTADGTPPPARSDDLSLSPAVRRLIEEHRLDPAQIEASGKGGRLLKEDVLRHIERQERGATPGAPGVPGPAMPGAAPGPPVPPAPRAAPVPRAMPPTPRPAEAAPSTPSPADADERIVPMSPIRQRIAERLVRAQHTAAILTTFNEIDMSAVAELRGRHREGFERRHGVKLGLMGFFTRAAVLALAEIPELNAEIRGTDIAYRRRVHMGIAVGTERGLVVPVVRDAHALALAGVEREIARLAERARDGILTLQELSGGTFTLSNGGVYGSLLSTPILNPPQSGILGLHKIEKRPIALDDQVVIRPMMYVALSYDHRIVDGEQAVTFLKLVKERIEDPERMLLDV